MFSNYQRRAVWPNLCFSKLVLVTVTHEHRAFDFLMQRVSVALQRGNAACILGTLASNKDLDAIYYLI